jgi:hypothetical protein
LEKYYEENNMINPKHLRMLAENTLSVFELNKGSAINLVLGTIAQESALGYYLRQNTKIFSYLKHGLGIGQIENNTFEWLRDHYKTAKYPLGEYVQSCKFLQLEYDLRASIVFVRLRYLIVPEPLPLKNDIMGMARYWKKHYNTYKGKGKVEEFIPNYNLVR